MASTRVKKLFKYSYEYFLNCTFCLMINLKILYIIFVLPLKYAVLNYY